MKVVGYPNYHQILGVSERTPAEHDHAQVRWAAKKASKHVRTHVSLSLCLPPPPISVSLSLSLSLFLSFSPALLSSLCLSVILSRVKGWGQTLDLASRRGGPRRASWVRVQCFGFRVWGLESGNWGLGFGIWGVGLGGLCLVFVVWGLGFGIWSLRGCA